MQENILFIAPEYDIKGPRGLRMENLLREHNSKNNYLLKFRINSIDDYQTTFHFRFSWFYRFLYNYNLFGLVRRLLRNRYIDRETIFLKTIVRDVDDFLKKHEINKIIVLCSPFSLYALAPIFREKKPALKIVYDIGDPYYLNSVSKKKSQKINKKKIETDMLENSNAVIVTNDSTKLMYNRLYNFPIKNIEVVPQGVNLKYLEPLENNSEFDHSEKVKIIYSGIFYKDLRDPSNFFNAIKDIDGYSVEIYGSKLKHNIKNVTFHDRIGQIELFQKMQSSNVLLFIDNRKGIQTPGKIFELLSFQKNILFIYENDRSVTLKFVKELNSSNIIIVKNDMSSIKRILNSKVLTVKNRTNYSIKQFSWGERARKYFKFVHSI